MLTHIDHNNQPTMVDISEKNSSIRMALAKTEVQLPQELAPYLKGEELILAKGPVFQTAIIAGTMAVKKTFEAIPFCHQIPIESCKFFISIDANLLVTIQCRVKTSFKTGVEMEALHGALTAALTIYDMCKAVTHNILIKETRLMAKTGGKRTILDRPLYGLVLTGGKSQRMGEAKALISYHGKSHAAYLVDILKDYCQEVFLSTAEEGQWKGTELENIPTIVDFTPNFGPVAGMLSAFKKYPNAYWFIVACDLVYFSHDHLEKIPTDFRPEALATAYENVEGKFPEALCALYSPAAESIFHQALENDIRCPVKVLKQQNINLLQLSNPLSLANINTPEERKNVHH